MSTSTTCGARTVPSERDAVLRTKYLAGLQRAFDAGELAFAGGTAALVDRQAFTTFVCQLRAVDGSGLIAHYPVDWIV